MPGRLALLLSLVLVAPSRYTVDAGPQPATSPHHPNCSMAVGAQAQPIGGGTAAAAGHDEDDSVWAAAHRSHSRHGPRVAPASAKASTFRPHIVLFLFDE
jgi:hypothetical protein